jgi:hypothetical protein
LQGGFIARDYLSPLRAPTAFEAEQQIRQLGDVRSNAPGLIARL